MFRLFTSLPLLILLLVLSLEGQEPMNTLELEEFVVEGVRYQVLSDYQGAGISILTQDKLDQLAQPTLGETFSWQAGVTSSFFGTASSRPVIRGFDGNRIRVLEGGVGSGDVSDESPDHAVAIEPLFLRSAEIYRGPSSLLFGNAAIGGAVNVETAFIPLGNNMDEETLRWHGRFDSVSDGYSTAAIGTLSEGPLSVRVSASYRDQNDYRIPGKARTDLYDFYENPPVQNPEGEVPNTFSRSQMEAVGIAYNDAKYQVGLAYSNYRAAYGVPYVFDGSPVDPVGDVTLDPEREKLELDGRWYGKGEFIKEISVRVGMSDYRHQEWFDEIGGVNLNFRETLIEQESGEARVDIHHRVNDSISGIVGVQVRNEDFLSDSLFGGSPGTGFYQETKLNTANLGLFIIETMDVGVWQFQAGARLEVQDLDVEQFSNTKVSGQAESFSLGVTRYLGNGWRTGGTLTYSERIPTGLERYAFYQHSAIGRFEVGGDVDLASDPLDNEESYGVEVFVERESERYNGRLSAYAYDFANYIFLEDDPTFAPGFVRAARYVEREALIYGYELEWETVLYEAETEKLTLAFLHDYVHGQDKTADEPLPRMPPYRFGIRPEYTVGDWVMGADLRYVGEQKRLRELPIRELPSSDYYMVNLDLQRVFRWRGFDVMARLQLMNLFDEEARMHTSFLKDVAPLPGTNIAISLDVRF